MACVAAFIFPTSQDRARADTVSDCRTLPAFALICFFFSPGSFNFIVSRLTVNPSYLIS